jgi:hypothetical protein
MIAQDFAFRGNKAGNKLRNFRDHGPGRGADGTTWTKRARAALARKLGISTRTELLQAIGS